MQINSVLWLALCASIVTAKPTTFFPRERVSELPKRVEFRYEPGSNPQNYPEQPETIAPAGHLPNKDSSPEAAPQTWLLKERPEHIKMTLGADGHSSTDISSQMGIFYDRETNVFELYASPTLSKALAQYIDGRMSGVRYKVKQLISSKESLRARALKKTRTWDEAKWESVMEQIQENPLGYMGAPLGYMWHTETAAERIKNVAIFQEARQLLLKNPKAGLKIIKMSGVEPDKMQQKIMKLNMDLTKINELRRIYLEGLVTTYELAPPARSNSDEGEKEDREYAIDLAVANTRPLVGQELGKSLRLAPFTNTDLETAVLEWQKWRAGYITKVIKEAGQSWDKEQAPSKGPNPAMSRRDILVNISDQINDASTNATAAKDDARTESEAYLSAFHTAQSQTANVVTPYIADILISAPNNTLITGLAISVFADLTASNSSAIGPAMYGLDCFDWLESQISNDTQKDVETLSDEDVAQLALYALLDDIYMDLWGNITTKLSETGLTYQIVGTDNSYPAH